MPAILSSKAAQEPTKLYFTPTQFEKSGSVWPMRILIHQGKSTLLPAKKMRIEPHYHLIFFLEGEGTIVQKDKPYLLKRNDLFCIFPQVPHEYWAGSQIPRKYIWLTFDGPQSAHLLERIGIKRCVPHKTGAVNESTLFYLRELIALAQQRMEQDHDLVRISLMLQLFRSLSQDVPEEIRNVDCIDEWLYRGRAYMELHYSEDLNIETIAKYVGIERSYFSRKFKETFDITPLKYLQQIRIDVSKQLLEETDLNLTSIAHSVGYVDMFSFSKAFKKLTGLSPAAYRSKKNFQ